MPIPSLLLFGAGGHATACIDVVELEGKFAIAGLIASESESRKRITDYLVIGSDDDIVRLVGEYPRALIAIGQIKTAAPRVRLFEQLNALGCRMPTIVSPRAYVSPRATLGAGTIVMHGAIVNANAVVGDNCIVNSRALIEHDAVVAGHCHIATGAVVNGHVRVGAQTFVGSGSVLREGIVLGERCIVGMGQIVLSDGESGCCYPSVVNS